MGRKTTNPVGKLFFKYNVDKNDSSCIIEGCHRTIKGRHSQNLETHIRSYHADEYEILVKSKVQNIQKVTENDKRQLQDPTTQSKKRGPMDDIITVTKKSLNVKMDKIILLKACTEMVTVNGRPLTIFNDSGFKKILKPLVEAIGGDFTINSHNIKKHIFSTSNTIISEINDDVKNKLVSLKIDCVKRHFRSIMGVNIQYIKNGKVCLATLAMRELNEQHTSENLKILLLDVLKAYNIRKEQIYTITCDNAANMVKLARIMNEECEVVPNDEEIINVTNPDENNDDSDFEVEYENQDGTLLSADDIESELFNDQFVNNENTNKEVEDFQESVIAAIEPKSITSCIRCSVHSLQLCVLVGLKNAPIINCITEARKIVKKLRTPKYATWLNRKNLKYAIIDIETRWNSLYNMLYRLLELKEFCKLHEETNADLKLNNCEWNSIQSIVNALNPVKIATVALQRQDLNLGDFYGIWLRTIHGLTSNGSILAKTIKTAMEKEIQDKYLKNSTFLAAIFLDPRYQALLTSNQRSDAINRLIVTWETILLLNGADQTSESSELLLDNTVNSCITENNQESEDPFEQFLSSQSSVLSQLSTTSNPTEAISTILNNFNNVQRVSHTVKIIEYWETQKVHWPELYQLASVALAVPATQVSVERSFSGLKFIVSDLRASLDPDVLEAIMIIRCNEQFKNNNC